MTWPREGYMIHIPSDWTPEQALAVHDFLADLTEAVWQSYQDPMSELLQAEESRAEYQPDLIGLEDTSPI